MENAGFSVQQIIISLMLCFVSVLTLYFIPATILDMEVKKIFLLLTFLLVGCILGVCFVF